MSRSNQLSKVFKALSNPHRLDLYLKIKNHHDIDVAQKTKRICFLSQLCENLKIGAPTISHHLKELVNAGLVETTKEGKFAVCTINDQIVTEVADLFKTPRKK